MRSVVEAQEDSEAQALQLKLELIKKLKMTRLSCEPEDPTLFEDVEEESKEEVPFEMKIYQEAKACSQAIHLVENSLNNQIESLKKAEEMQKKLVKQMLGAGVDM